MVSAWKYRLSCKYRHIFLFLVLTKIYRIHYKSLTLRHLLLTLQYILWPLSYILLIFSWRLHTPCMHTISIGISFQILRNMTIFFLIDPFSFSIFWMSRIFMLPFLLYICFILIILNTRRSIITIITFFWSFPYTSIFFLINMLQCHSSFVLIFSSSWIIKCSWSIILLSTCLLSSSFMMTISV